MPAAIELTPTITRSQLYNLVWRHESKALAEACGTQGTLIWRLCKRWNIPKPGRGYWQQVQVGRTFTRPPLQIWPGRAPDPAVMRGGPGGYGTIMPPRERVSRAKAEPLEGLRERVTEARKRDEERHAATFELLTGPAVRHLLIVEDWHIEHHLDINFLSPSIFHRDEPIILLDCRYVLPNRRRGKKVRATINGGPGPHLADDEREASRGTITFGKREMHLRVGEEHAAFLCAAFAAGRIRALELEVVKSPGSPETIRWAKLCTRTHDGAEGGLRMSES